MASNSLLESGRKGDRFIFAAPDFEIINLSPFLVRETQILIKLLEASTPNKALQPTSPRLS